MFDPNQDLSEDEGVSGESLAPKLGSKQSYRKSNENLYNLRHLNKFGKLENEASLK